MLSRLYVLFLQLVIAASAVVAFGIWGILAAAAIIASVEYIRSAKSLRQALVKLLIALLCCLLILGLLLPAFQEARESSRRASCANNLKQLAMALHAYHDVYGCFPPAYIADKDGKPMHSWRVLILPFIDYRGLYEQYNFDEPWNGPNNRKLSGHCDYPFACPSDAKAGSPDRSMTSYVAVVGSKTAWPGNTSAKLDDFSSGGSNTILLVEVANSDIPWMEPRDLTFEEACRGINKGNAAGISSPHVMETGRYSALKKGAFAAFADCGVHFLPEDIAHGDLERMLTRESTKAVYLDPYQPGRIGVIEVAAMVVMIVSAFLLLMRPKKRAKTATV
jgi:hypothetical protein